MQNEIRQIATAFKWLDENADYIRLPSEFPGFCCRSIGDDGSGAVVMFAVCAKAEMARRGWFASYDGNTCSGQVEMYDEFAQQANREYIITEEREFDPKDALSEARALIQCIAEALR